MATATKKMAVKASSTVRKSKVTMRQVDPKAALQDDVDDDSDVVSMGVDVTTDKDFLASRDDSAEARTVASRERIRRQMESDMQAFLTRGGAVQQILPNVMADPPRRPSTAYGSRPI